MESTTSVGRYGNVLTCSGFVEPVRTRMVRRPASSPEMTSVSMRSPTIIVVLACASMARGADRIMNGFGLPTKYGLRLLAAWLGAATAPVAGNVPQALGPLGSGLVAMNREPDSMSLIARVIASKPYVLVSPRTT